MAYLGSFARHNTSSGRQKYLEVAKDPTGQMYLEQKTEERYVARDLMNIPPDRTDDWGAYMDETRSAFANDTDWGDKAAVTYQEFVISPDPKDDITLEQLRELACSWTDKWFGDDGRLGTYQVAIVYHDDNSERIARGEKGILHAHVHVCNTDLETGRRLHIDNADNRDLSTTLQQMCQERGLSYFAVDKLDTWIEKGEVRALHRAQKSERAMIERGSFSWKEDLRCYIEVAMRTTRSIEDYESMLADMHIAFEERDGDYVYTHPFDTGSKHYRCFGSTLGAGYTKQTIAMWQDKARRGIQRKAPRSYPSSAREQIRDYVLGIAGHHAAIAPGDMTAKDVVSCLRTNDTFGICCMADYERQLAYLDSRITSMSSPTQVRVLSRERDRIASAERVAAAGDFFCGLTSADVDRIRSPRAASSSAGASTSSASSASGASGRERAPERTRRQTPKSVGSTSAPRPKGR